MVEPPIPRGSGGRPGRPRTRRQSHGSAWHWRQTDCWYYTLPGTKRRVPLFDEDGNRIRGKENRDKARLALARVRAGRAGRAGRLPAGVRRLGGGPGVLRVPPVLRPGGGQRDASAATTGTPPCSYLNDLCRYCGALPVAQLKKGHIRTWVDQHTGWKSPATERSALTIVIAAFNYCQDNFDVPNPLKGLKKPAVQAPAALPVRGGRGRPAGGGRPGRSGTSCSPPCTPGCGRSASWPG